jgi:hypothetical protein
MKTSILTIALTLFCIFSGAINGIAQIENTETLPMSDTTAIDPYSDGEEPIAESVVDDTTSVPSMGFYALNMLDSARPFKYPAVNKTHVLFYKRVWRDMNLNDTANVIFKTPGMSIAEAIRSGVRTGKIVAYDATPTRKDPYGDGFKKKMKPREALNMLQDSTAIPETDSEGQQIIVGKQANDFDPESIVKIRIMEDIFYDTKRSRIETRIVGVAPVRLKGLSGDGFGAPAPSSDNPFANLDNATADAGSPAGGGAVDANGVPTDINNTAPLVDGTSLELVPFWINYEQARNYLATKEIVDPQRDARALSYDDIFIRHSFSSTIHKESNPRKLNSGEIKDPQEKARIERELKEYVSKTWEYKKKQPSAPAPAKAAEPKAAKP